MGPVRAAQPDVRESIACQKAGTMIRCFILRNTQRDCLYG